LSTTLPWQALQSPLVAAGVVWWGLDVWQPTQFLTIAKVGPWQLMQVKIVSGTPFPSPSGYGTCVPGGIGLPYNKWCRLGTPLL
jgi:hypothetical protein